MRRRNFGRKASYLTSIAVVAHTIWTSAAPALTYPVYAKEWGLTTFTTTAIFAVYPVFVVLVLVLFGNVSDYIGRRETMMLGLLASTLGALVFTVAPGVGWIFVGRAFMGMGVGLSAGPSAAAVLEFSAPKHTRNAGAMTAAAQAIGMTGAAVIGGALIQYGPYPTRLNFAVLTVILVFVIIATWHLPNHTASRPHGRWRPSIPSIPNGFFRTFVTATSAVTTSYILGAMTLSLGAQIAHDLVSSENALVNGAIIAVFAAASLIATVPLRKKSSGFVIRVASIASMLAAGCLSVAAEEGLIWAFAVAQVCAGVAYSLLLLGGLSLVNEGAPKAHRAATLSALFLVAYLAQAVVALSLGRLATALALPFAVIAGVLLIVFLSSVTLILNSARSRLERSSRSHVSADS